MYAAITGWGSYAPERVMTNADLEQMVDTSDEWIRARTGIQRRHIAAPGQATSDLAIRAAKIALERAELTAADLDLIVVATMTPDYLLPCTASVVLSHLNAGNAGAMDINAACAGFVYALSAVTAMIRGGGVRRVLLCGSEVNSRYLNWNDRNTCILFGDGAGALVLEASENERGLLAYKTGSVPDTVEDLWIKASGSRYQLSADNLTSNDRYIQMNGPEVFKHAVRGMTEGSLDVLNQVGKTPADVALMVPHQANIRIIEATAKRLDFPMERVMINLDEYGNTSGATIPLALAEAADAGRLNDGDLVLTSAIGGGLTWAAGLLRWGGRS